jgi:GDPmannose 4,6-dehydratase
MMTTQTPQKTAIITGIAGQDGSYLTELLLDRGYRVVGTVRNLEQASKRFPIELLSRIRIIVSPGPVPAQSWFDELIQSVAPHEIYNLSGVSFVPASTLDPASAAEEIGMGAVRMLQAIRNFAPQGRLYQACSSELFGYKGAYPQNENTPIAPGSLYGASKAFAFFSVQQFREHFGLYCVSGIAYNHESPRRPENFVSRRISLGVAKVKPKEIGDSPRTMCVRCG